MKLPTLAAAIPFTLSTLIAACIVPSARALAGTPMCFGDGTAATPCPCDNSASSPGNGCANSAFAAGGLLTDVGNPGTTALTDMLVFTAANVTGPGLFIQGSAVLDPPVAFGDGLRCVGGNIVRISVAFPTAGVATYPLTGQTQIHVAGATAIGDTRHYQFWYRDVANFCTVNTFNLTNGLTINWTA